MAILFDRDYKLFNNDNKELIRIDAFTGMENSIDLKKLIIQKINQDNNLSLESDILDEYDIVHLDTNQTMTQGDTLKTFICNIIGLDLKKAITNPESIYLYTLALNKAN